MDAAACIREFDGVGEQVVPHQSQQLAVRTDGHAVRNVRLNSKLFCLPCVLKAQQAFSKLLTQIVGLRLREDLLIFQLVQFENIGDQVRQAADASVTALAYSTRCSFGRAGSCSREP